MNNREKYNPNADPKYLTHINYSDFLNSSSVSSQEQDNLEVCASVQLIGCRRAVGRTHQLKANRIHEDVQR